MRKERRSKAGLGEVVVGGGDGTRGLSGLWIRPVKKKLQQEIRKRARMGRSGRPGAHPKRASYDTKARYFGV